MRNYYEILDVKIWEGQKQHFQLPKSDEAKEILQVIVLIALAFVFWYLAETFLKYKIVLNLIGWFFGLWSLFRVKTHPIFRKTS